MIGFLICVFSLVNAVGLVWLDKKQKKLTQIVKQLKFQRMINSKCLICMTSLFLSGFLQVVVFSHT